MMDLYCKSFVFKVTRYEEWNDNKCVSKGDTNLKIVAIPVHDYMTFRIFGKLDLSIALGFGVNMKSTIQTSDYIQYGIISENMHTKQPTVPKVCKLYGNQTCIRFDLLMPLRSIVLYGFYDEKALISSIEQIANEIVWLYKRRETQTKIIMLGIEWLNSIKNNPVKLLEIHNTQIMVHALLSMFRVANIRDLNVLELIGDIGYWSISKAIELEPDNWCLYSDRLAFMVIASEAMKWAAMKALNLAKSIYMPSNPEIKARDAVYKMTIADIYNHPEVCKYSSVALQHKMDLDNKMRNNFFYPQTDIKDIIETGISFHRQMYSDLSQRIQGNDFDIDFD